MKQNPTILISLTRNEEALERLASVCPGAEVRIGPWVNEPKGTLPTDLMRGAEAVLCEFPPANFHDFDQLRWMQLTSAGYGHILHLPLLERGIRVTNARGIFDIPIAEWNIMMILMWHRHMLESLKNQKERTWDRSAEFQAELRGCVVGFWGYGGIARETTRILKAMGLTVWTMTRDGKTSRRERIYCVEGTGDPDGVLPDRVFGPDRAGEFLEGLDYLILSMPLTPTTRGTIGEDKLRRLRPSAVLINPARAQLIDEEVFIRCMREGWIRGCSLDVHYAYPLPPEHPVWSLPNLILTPHVSGSAAGTHFLERVYDIFVTNVQHWISGEPMLNALTDDQLRGK